MILNIETHTLHKYYVWANRMRTHFDELLKETQPVPENKGMTFEENMYMSLWYGCLYVVIEGWKELGLKDEKIETLLSSENVDLLKRYRNGSFHFQKDYFDDRFLDFVQKDNSAEWIRDLNEEFGRYFLSLR